MNIDLKFNIEDNVRIISTNTIGTVTFIRIEICDGCGGEIGISIVYSVSYPDCNGEPESKMFYACELEEVEETKFGFGDKDDIK